MITAHKILKDVSTGLDGVSFDIGRISWMICNFSIFCVASYTLFKGGAVSIVDMGTALSAIAVSHAGSIYLKKDTEPRPHRSTDEEER